MFRWDAHLVVTYSTNCRGVPLPFYCTVYVFVCVCVGVHVYLYIIIIMFVFEIIST